MVVAECQCGVKNFKEEELFGESWDRSEYPVVQIPPDMCVFGRCEECNLNVEILEDSGISEELYSKLTSDAFDEWSSQQDWDDMPGFRDIDRNTLRD